MSEHKHVPTPTQTQTPTTAEQPRGKRQFPLLWLRGLAAVAVLTFHAYQHQRSGPEHDWPFEGVAHQLMTGTDLFVDMFFVLSAFVLWLPVARAVIDQGPDRPGWVVLFRRSARLLPLYLTVVLVVWTLTNPSLPGHWQDLLLHLTFTHVYSDEYIFWTNGPAWSLAVEFHFYLLIALVIPLVQRAGARAASRAGRLAAALALPAVLAVAGLTYLWWQITVNQTAHDNYSAWFNPLAKAPDFAIGMALAVLSAAGVRLGAAARGTVATLGLGALVVLVLTRDLSAITTNWWHPMYALAIAVALAALVLHDGPWPTWMSWRPVAWVGGLGYGIYLIHEPVLRFLGSLGLYPEPAQGPGFLWVTLLVSAVSIALAWVSSRTVEAAGLKALSLVDDRGRARDYYPHVTEEQTASRD